MPRSHRQHLLGLVAAVLLAGCGGGTGDDDTSQEGSGASATARVQDLAGDWVQKGCSSIGGQSHRKFLRATPTGGSEVRYAEGVLSYGGTDCAGASRLTGPSPLGNVVFSRSQAEGVLAAHWGDFHTVAGSRVAVIWTLRSGNLLCLLGDEKPSIQPTLSDVSASLAALPESSCFQR